MSRLEVELKRRIMFFLEGFKKKKKKSAHLWMKHRVPFLRVSCTRLLVRQGLPFVNEFPERQHYQGLSAQCYVCVCECVWLRAHKHMFAGRGRHSWSWERETEECLLGAAAGVSVMLFLLSVIVLRVCVCVTEVIEAKDEKALSSIPQC